MEDKSINDNPRSKSDVQESLVAGIKSLGHNWTNLSSNVFL